MARSETVGAERLVTEGAFFLNRRPLIMLFSLLTGSISSVAAADESTPKSSAATASSEPALPSPADVRRAEVLFQKARALKKQGKAEEACPLFEASQRLDPNGGTLVNIAECHDAQGKTGTAWHELSSALDAAKNVGDKDLVNGIQAQLTAMVPRLPQVVIEIPRRVRLIPNVLIRIDGKNVRANEPIHTEVVNTGTHTISATAAGHVDFYRKVMVTGERLKVDVLVSLEKVKPPPLPPPPDRTLTYVFGGLAGVSLTACAPFIAFATTKPQSTELLGGAVATCAVTIGSAVTALVLYVSEPPATAVTRAPRQKTDFALHPVLGPHLTGIAVTGNF